MGSPLDTLDPDEWAESKDENFHGSLTNGLINVMKDSQHSTSRKVRYVCLTLNSPANPVTIGCVPTSDFRRSPEVQSPECGSPVFQ